MISRALSISPPLPSCTAAARAGNQSARTAAWSGRYRELGQAEAASTWGGHHLDSLAEVVPDGWTASGCLAFLAARWHFLQTHSPPIMSTCLPQTAALHRTHVAAGAETRAARLRFGPPHSGHSPAARLTYS